ncbi:DUF309 domain-containing protein [Niallia endozanthoxylica]|uniref:DUF309 domain-containing protein n=1 Tax=Niallia endozanthoxylica TaxID=2036016 RepID=A0A5J5HX22_9BACI|nr:DUF309 domain-containing protein [Niallia endozanthoxylica]KAA9026178.1 DUF309 domain-containing protein [Niallia endozanthoxylica]
MTFPLEYIDFLVHFHGDRDYFECHELLEEYWKEVDIRNKESVWVGLIQLAVANYHHRRGNFNGALRTLKKALRIISSNEELIQKLGLNPLTLVDQIKERKAAIEERHDYQSMNLPIQSSELLEQCKARSKELSMTWLLESDLTNTQIVHRHKERDRTTVIEERNKAKQKKTNRRQ